MKLKGFVLIAGMLIVFRVAAGPRPPEVSIGPGTDQSAGAQATGSASASAQAGPEDAALAGGTAMNAVLNAPVDSKKAKAGDAVTAHTTEAVKPNGQTVIPKGTKLMGHVTQASSRAKGESESALGVVFDKAILKNGQEITLNAAIQAMAAAQTSAAIGGSDIDAIGGVGGSAAGSGAAGGRGGIGGVTATAGGAVGVVTNTAASVGGAAGNAAGGAANATVGAVGSSKGAIGGLNAAGELTSNSQGVFGLNGLNIVAAGSRDTQGSVITSTGKNVHLDSGTRLLVVTQSEAGKPKPEAEKPKAEKRENEPKREMDKPMDQ